MPVAIRIENLSKLYRLGEVGTGTISHDLNRWWAKIRGKEDPYALVGQENRRDQAATSDYAWALRDINFEVEQGEVLGIIGANGAGKSTLLKLISRITSPTSGYIRAKGRIASLLEVGTGMHPEMTARENIYLNGAILGMKRHEITKKFDEIVDFAGCQMYVDTPVKRYSSGMRVRLGFAVAAFLEPEILIVDEVLAVGDAEFQKRAIGKMGEVSKANGKTILFVSHNMQAVSTLTQRSVVLREGFIGFQGSTQDAIASYLEDNVSRQEEYIFGPIPRPSYVHKVEISTSEPAKVHRFGKPLRITFTIVCTAFTADASLSFQVLDEHGRPVAHLWVFDSEKPLCRHAGTYIVTCHIPQPRMYLGAYSITIHFGEGASGDKYQEIEGVCPFEVVMHELQRPFPWVRGACAYIEDSCWTIEERPF